MTRKAICAKETLVDGKFISGLAVIIENGSIVELLDIGQVSKDTKIDHYSDSVLVPGFVDIQVNGGGGVLFNDNPSVSTIEKIGSAHRKYGTTSFLPTIISDDLEKVAEAIAAVDEAIKSGVPGVEGIHIEGPFLNEQKKGIHDASKFRRLSENDIKLLTSLKSGKTLLTIAPEVNDNELISTLHHAGIILSAGHTNASYEQAMSAVNKGISGFTHLYNAMSAFESRAPGVVGAAFDSVQSWASIIADGHHVHPAALKHAIECKGIQKTILITDAMPTVGSDVKEFWLGSEHITAKDGTCKNHEGSLAGSDLDMISAVKYVNETLGYKLEDAIAMATLSPSSFMKLDDKIGAVAVGKKANFVLLNEELSVTNTWIDGLPDNH
ncbi:MAG: N-acetylglucosamine-6-phosphate deacetylase [Kordiimonadaceae bacterium]|jgi:N-acetylglucosamine-6-phosphate deacetylase|nr:N-acetylglucosamine-6-phosphate deacetylase [Kordiimonadaceae bacterium]MBT6037344.1 N-acetylglucosamine-6-phosphate deacetylase [Kordiimonadaceae bacterium]MBT6330488.1 N-acetylglucosamine-6-phosphate deacetylase [Kordiimonadaceae bacterium]